MNEIEKRVYNIDLILDELKKFPHTYKTILKEFNDSGTLQTILRRKLNVLYKDGIINKTTIPGTRFGQVIIYIFPKTYNIIIEATRFGSETFYFYNYEKLSRYYIKVTEYWKLNNIEWNKMKDEKIFFEGHILKWI